MVADQHPLDHQGGQNAADLFLGPVREKLAQGLDSVVSPGMALLLVARMLFIEAEPVDKGVDDDGLIHAVGHGMIKVAKDLHGTQPICRFCLRCLHIHGMISYLLAFRSASLIAVSGAFSFLASGSIFWRSSQANTSVFLYKHRFPIWYAPGATPLLRILLNVSLDTQISCITCFCDSSSPKP